MANITVMFTFTSKQLAFDGSTKRRQGKMLNLVFDMWADTVATDFKLGDGSLTVTNASELADFEHYDVAVVLDTPRRKR